MSSSLGELVGFNGTTDEGIVVFNELSKRNEPMGKFRTLAVFPQILLLLPEEGL